MTNYSPLMDAIDESGVETEVTLDRGEINLSFEPQAGVGR